MKFYSILPICYTGVYVYKPRDGSSSLKVSDSRVIFFPLAFSPMKITLDTLTPLLVNPLQSAVDTTVFTGEIGNKPKTKIICVEFSVILTF